MQFQPLVDLLEEEEGNDAIASRTRSHKVLSVDESLDEEDEMMKEECLDEEISVHVVEVPVKEHGKPEVIEAKAAEIKNLESFGTFEEVADVGQSTIGSRWIITRKEAHDNQKKKCKGRIVARGFQEQQKPQSDSPTVLRASVKTFVAVAANEGFEICSIDITGAFLQAEDLDREVFVKPPVDIRKDWVIWRLKKPLYGLDDSSRKFYIRVKKMFINLGFEVLEGDAAYFYIMKEGKLYGQISTHVDDFNMAGEKTFI